MRGECHTTGIRMTFTDIISTSLLKCSCAQPSATEPSKHSRQCTHPVVQGVKGPEGGVIHPVDGWPCKGPDQVSGLLHIGLQVCRGDGADDPAWWRELTHIDVNMSGHWAGWELCICLLALVCSAQCTCHGWAADQPPLVHGGHSTDTTGCLGQCMRKQ